MIEPEVRNYTQQEAESIIESLRNGIPPVGFLLAFTVGRPAEVAHITRVLERLNSDNGEALLVEANYGGGKTHLLRVIREMALDAGYSVALVTVDSRAGVRFNRMDQVMGAVMRSIELDASSGKGVAPVFDAFDVVDKDLLDPPQRAVYEKIRPGGEWGYSEGLKAPALFLALRAWSVIGTAKVKETIANWLSNPSDFKSSRTMLYYQLVRALPRGVKEPRPQGSFYHDSVFTFDASGHTQAWDALSDLDTVVKVCGRRGLVLLFDEFEDVIQNLNNIAFQQQAFINLFRIFEGERFPGASFFAVTPEFVHKCVELLQSRYVYGFPVDKFQALDKFEMTEIQPSDFVGLARKIVQVHGVAYSWAPEAVLDELAIEGLVKVLFATSSADQIRQAVQKLVANLDRILDE